MNIKEIICNAYNVRELVQLIRFHWCSHETGMCHTKMRNLKIWVSHTSQQKIIYEQIK